MTTDDPATFIEERQRPFLAVYCVLILRGQLLMMRRQNTGYADGHWSVPAGHADGDESITAAASRELLEETGLVAQTSAWTPLCVMHRKTPHRHVIDVFLRATAWKGEVRNVEPEKCSALGFYGLSSLPTPVVPYVKRAIEGIDLSTTDFRFLEEGWT